MSAVFFLYLQFTLLDILDVCLFIEYTHKNLPAFSKKDQMIFYKYPDCYLVILKLAAMLAPIIINPPARVLMPGVSWSIKKARIIP